MLAKLCGVAEPSQTHNSPWGSAFSAYSGCSQDRVMRNILLLETKNLLLFNWNLQLTPSFSTLFPSDMFWVSWVLWDHFYVLKYSQIETCLSFLYLEDFLKGFLRMCPPWNWRGWRHHFAPLKQASEVVMGTTTNWKWKWDHQSKLMRKVKLQD